MGAGWGGHATGTGFNATSPLGPYPDHSALRQACKEEVESRKGKSGFDEGFIQLCSENANAAQHDMTKYTELMGLEMPSLGVALSGDDGDVTDQDLAMVRAVSEDESSLAGSEPNAHYLSTLQPCMTRPKPRNYGIQCQQIMLLDQANPIIQANNHN